MFFLGSSWLGYGDVAIKLQRESKRPRHDSDHIWFSDNQVSKRNEGIRTNTVFDSEVNSYLNLINGGRFYSPYRWNDILINTHSALTWMFIRIHLFEFLGSYPSGRMIVVQVYL